MADSTVLWEGFGRGTWSQSTWGQEVVLPSATGGVGSVTVGIGADVTVTGIGATGALGSVSITVGTGVSVSVTGVA